MLELDRKVGEGKQAAAHVSGILRICFVQFSNDIGAAEAWSNDCRLAVIG